MSAEYLYAAARVQFGTAISAAYEHRANVMSSNNQFDSQKKSRVFDCPHCSSLWIPGITCEVRLFKHKISNANQKTKSNRQNKKAAYRNKKFEQKLKEKLKENFIEYDRNYLHYRCTACSEGYRIVPSFTKPQQQQKKKENETKKIQGGGTKKQTNGKPQNAEPKKKLPGPFGASLNLQDFLL